MPTGRKLSQSTGSHQGLPRFCLHMIALGEESGNLDVCMSSLADYYEKEMPSQAVSGML